MYKQNTRSLKKWRSLKQTILNQEAKETRTQEKFPHCFYSEIQLGPPPIWTDSLIHATAADE